MTSPSTWSDTQHRYSDVQPQSPSSLVLLFPTPSDLFLLRISLCWSTCQMLTAALGFMQESHTCLPQLFSVVLQHRLELENRARTQTQTLRDGAWLPRCLFRCQFLPCFSCLCFGGCVGRLQSRQQLSLRLPIKEASGWVKADTGPVL